MSSMNRRDFVKSILATPVAGAAVCGAFTGAAATNPDPRLDSFAAAVWGALREYDWTELNKKGVVQ